MKNRIFLRAVAAVLLSCAVLSLAGCGREPRPPVVQQGIALVPDAPYTAEVLARAEETVYPLVLCYAEEQGLILTNTLREHYRAVAKEIVAILARSPVDERIFLAALESLDARGEAAVMELSAYFSGEGSTLSQAAALYRSLAALTDSEAVLKIAYELMLYTYDYRVEDARAKYEKYGGRRYLEQIEALTEEKATVCTEIGQPAFTAAVGQALALADLFFGGALEGEALAAFSDEELLVFLRQLEIEPVQIGTRGWELILALLTPEKTAADTAYAQRLLSAVRASGDARALAAVCGDLSALLASAAQRVSAAEIALLREGKYADALQAVMFRFTDADFARLARIGALRLEGAAYESAAAAQYGDGYTAYAQSLTPVSAEGLRACLGTEKFLEGLEGFIGGISPALSYGMRK